MITGKTRVFGITADPIGHVQAPQTLNALFAERGIDAVLVPLHVRAADYARLLDGLRGLQNFGGFLITVPHKVATARLCDALGATAARVGSANAVRREADGRLIGEMFDGAGFVAALRAGGCEPAGKAVLLLGAGGAGMAIAYALAEAGVRRLRVVNRSRDKAERLVAGVAEAAPGTAVEVGAGDPSGFDLVVNATSLGLRADDPLPLDVERLEANTAVAEIIMEPETTPLLAAAQARGCPVFYGRPMLREQVRLFCEFWGLEQG